MPDPASLAISTGAFAFTIAAFAWQHWRKVDSVICTIVAVQPVHGTITQEAAFQFSFANLGTRAVLIRDIGLNVCARPDNTGISTFEHEVVTGQLPQVLKAGEMCFLTAKIKWNLTILCQAFNGVTPKGDEVFFTAKATAWNPKGKRLFGEKKHIASMKLESSGYGFYASEDRSFVLKKCS